MYFIGDSEDTVTIGFIGHEDNSMDSDNSVDAMCQSTNSTLDGVHSIASGLDSCGTKAAYASDGKLLFTNILEVTARTFSNGLRFNNEASIPGTEFYSIGYKLVGSFIMVIFPDRRVGWVYDS